MTCKIALGGNRFATIDDEDLALISTRDWRLIGNNRRGFYATSADEPSVSMHRLILGEPENSLVDHRDRNGLNNVRSNLRPATHAENMRNRAKSRHKLGEYKGVFAKANRFQALINLDYRQFHLGSFASAIEAALAYDQAAKVLHGEFACLNFSGDRDWLFLVPTPDITAALDRARQVQPWVRR